MVGGRVSLAALLLALPLWAVTATPAYACTCLPTTVAERVSAVDLIILDTVETIERIGDPPPEGEYDDRSMRVTVAVDEYLKGTGPDEIVHIERAGGSAMCQVGSEVGVAYLLFFGPPDDDGQYATSICGGSTRAANEDFVAEVRQILQGPAQTPTVGAFPDTGSAGGSPTSSILWPAIAAGGVGTLLASAALFALRRPGGN